LVRRSHRTDVAIETAIQALIFAGGNLLALAAKTHLLADFPNALAHDQRSCAIAKVAVSNVRLGGPDGELMTRKIRSVEEHDLRRRPIDRKKGQHKGKTCKKPAKPHDSPDCHKFNCASSIARSGPPPATGRPTTHAIAECKHGGGILSLFNPQDLKADGVAFLGDSLETGCSDSFR
jgi:hypothetical protein